MLRIQAPELPRIRRLFESQVLVPLGLVVYAAAVVTTEGLGYLDWPGAVFILSIPLIAVAAAIRPGWVVFILLAVPAGFLPFLPTRMLGLLLVVTLASQLFARGVLFIDTKSGLLPLGILLAAAHIFRADLLREGLAEREGFLNLLIYYLLLSLVSYNATRLGDLKLRMLTLALVLGSAGTAIIVLALNGFNPLALAGGGVRNVFEFGTHLGYLMVLTFTVCFAWALSDADHDNPRGYRRMALIASFFFLAMTSFAFTRGAWLVGLIALIYIPWRARKQAYWVLVPIAIALVVVIPSAQKRLTGDISQGVEQSLASGEFATGRWGLWTDLWDRGVENLPEGSGSGYVYTLDPIELFGDEKQFVSEANEDFVFPHNDFLFWMLELGVAGAVLIIAFWMNLFSVRRRIARRGDKEIATSVFIVGGVVLTFFMAELTDNGIFMRIIAERFFVVAGFTFGLAALDQSSQRSSVSQSGVE